MRQPATVVTVTRMSMNARARRVDTTLRQEISVGGHEITTDEPASLGGTDAGPPPHQLLPAALAGCIATTIELYARRRGWDVGEVAVDVDYDPDAVPRHFDVEVHLPGHLSAEQIERIARVAAKCPVRRSLERGFTFDERLIQLPRATERKAA
jgi:putative redox protein